MTTVILDGYIVNERENRLFFFSQEPVIGETNEFSAVHCGDNVFEIKLPIQEFSTEGIPQKCKITIELEK